MSQLHNNVSKHIDSTYYVLGVGLSTSHEFIYLVLMHDMGTTVKSNLKMRKLRHKEVKWLA